MSFYTSEELHHMNFKSIGKDVLISDKCSIYNASNISIGDYSRIDDFTILSAGDGGIDIGRYVHVACFASLIGKGNITLCDFSGVSSRVAVYSSSDNYDGEYMTNPCVPLELTNTVHKDVHIGKHVVVGANSVVLPGVILGDGCSVGALSLVNKSFSENQILMGIPAVVKKLRQLNMYQLEKQIHG